MRPIYLIGYMGCGKTTLGRAVAQRVSIPLIDLDEFIEQREGMTVRQIFEKQGEPYFRQAERAALLEVSRMTDVIVATGGGTPCQPGLLDIMLDSGTTVYLETSLDVLHRRLIDGRATRPLIARLDDNELKEFIIQALEARRPYYTRAAARFDSSRLETPEQIHATSTRFIHSFISEEAPE